MISGWLSLDRPYAMGTPHRRCAGFPHLANTRTEVENSSPLIAGELEAIRHLPGDIGAGLEGEAAEKEQPRVGGRTRLFEFEPGELALEFEECRSDLRRPAESGAQRRQEAEFGQEFDGRGRMVLCE